MTVSIRETLARVEGDTLPALEWPEVARHLRMHYLENRKEQERRRRSADLQRLYDGVGDDQMSSLIHSVLSHPDVQALREAWIQYARYVNPLRRVCNELATVYAEPAQRAVKGDPENQRRFAEVMRLAQVDLKMQTVDQLVELHHALAIGPRMRDLPTGESAPTLDVITPASFSAIRDPLDPTLCIGLIFELDTQLALGASAPKWRVWTYHETFVINSHGEIVETSVREHGYGRIPYILLTLSPVPGKLIDENASNDLEAAHKCIWFLNILHLKEAKSATKQTVVQGNTSRTVRDQVDDTERPILLGDEATASTLDRSMDFSKFLADAQQILEITAANRGIPPTVLRHGAVASADARELVRAPLKELRNRRLVAFRELERALAELFALVVAPRADLAFKLDGFVVDFADVTTTPGAKESSEIFEKDRTLGLTNTVDELMRRNPDLSPEEAVDTLRRNILVELVRNILMRPLQAISGAMGAPIPDASTDASANGAAPQRIHESQAETGSPNIAPDGRGATAMAAANAVHG